MLSSWEWEGILVPYFLCPFQSFCESILKQPEPNQNPSALHPRHTRSMPRGVQSPNSSVVSNQVLTPFNAHKQGLHPPLLTIWPPAPNPAHPACPAGQKKKIPLPPHPLPPQPYTHKTRLRVIKLWPKTVIKCYSQGGKTGMSCCSYQHFPVLYAYVCVCVCFLQGQQEVHLTSRPGLLLSCLECLISKWGWYVNFLSFAPLPSSPT